ncbi:MAG: hypothetical protein JST92_11000 [Deltaproteobacteria bacterium]|nr:hypothetical protein [Deltaproteobacteria bacterium]
MSTLALRASIEFAVHRGAMSTRSRSVVRDILAAVSLVFMLAGCTKSTEPDVVGKWSIPNRDGASLMVELKEDGNIALPDAPGPLARFFDDGRGFWGERSKARGLRWRLVKGHEPTWMDISLVDSSSGRILSEFIGIVQETSPGQLVFRFSTSGPRPTDFIGPKDEELIRLTRLH